MIIQLRRYKHGRVRNVHGKVISCKHSYVIMVYRLFKKPRYLHMLPGWVEKLSNGEICTVELTKAKYKATEFHEVGEVTNGMTKPLAEKLIAAIKQNPDNFILD